jgi:hypothetical protein
MIKNEENFVWYSTMSVIDYVDRIIIRDTGSQDNTWKILSWLKKKYPKKIDLLEVGDVNPEEYREVRQKMLVDSLCDWILILDGDEIWWEDSIKELVSIINSKGNTLDTIITSYFNPIDDIYHYQDEKFSQYKIGDYSGNITIRAINKKIEGLHIEGKHPLEKYCDRSGTPIQDMSDKRRICQKGKYFHSTFLTRSVVENDPKRADRRRIVHDLGHSFPLDFYYPEVFFLARPNIVPSPWERMNKSFLLLSYLESLLRDIKRKIV